MSRMAAASRSCAAAWGSLRCSGAASRFLRCGKDVMLMNRIGPSKMELYIANADGSGEHRLLPDSAALDYDPSFSPTGSGSYSLRSAMPRETDRRTSGESIRTGRAWSG